MLLNIVKPEQQNYKFSLSAGWPTSRDPYKILHTLKHIAESSKATDLKFGRRMHMNNFSKMDKYISDKERGLGHVTLIKFGTPSNISPK